MMKTIKINGLEIQLSDEAYEEAKKQFAGGKSADSNSDEYCYVMQSDDTIKTVMQGVFFDFEKFEKICNCFSCDLYTIDEIRQMVLQMRLWRMLHQFAKERGYLATAKNWENRHNKHFILYNHQNNYQTGYWEVTWSADCQNPTVVYFETYEAAKEAIEQVVEPFCKEHPEFMGLGW